MYIFAMRKLFLKIPVELPKPSSPKETHQSLLHAVGGGWYMNKSSQNIKPLRKRRLFKKLQQKEDEIKIKLQEANQAWNYWKFQIHWNKLEWMNPRNRDERKNSILCVLYIKKKITLKLHIGLVTCNSDP